MVLNLTDSSMHNLSSFSQINQTDTKRRMKLSESQKKMLFNLREDDTNSIAYLYSVKKVYNDVFLLFVLTEDVSNEKFYMITVDCLTKTLDSICLKECDFFDVIDQGENYETALFITKYFQVLNDTTISTRSIFRNEKKDINEGIILSSQIDSITQDYIIRRNGNFELINKDSIRINTVKE